MNLLDSIDQYTILDSAIRLSVAYPIALPVGWDREGKSNSVGLRTFPLLAMGSCAYLNLAVSALGSEPEAQARVFYGLMTGLASLGGGRHFKEIRSR